MLKALNKTAKEAQSAKLRKMGAMGSLDAAKKGEHAPRKYATGGMVDMPVGGGMGKPNLSKPGRSKSKGKGKSSTNVNVIVMPKPDAAPAGGPMPDMPMPAPKMAPPPAPPMAGPPMPPPGAGGPGPMGPGGPMGGPPMRKSGGKVLAFKTGGKVPANIRDGEKNTAMAKAHALEKGKGVGEQVKRKAGGDVAKFGGKMKESVASHDDKKADEALIRKMVKPAAMKAKASK